MQYNDCVYKPLLPYLLVASRHKEFNFARRLIDLFPYYRIDGPANLRIAEDLLESMSVHEGAYRPNVDDRAFRRFLSDGKYDKLDTLLDSASFTELLYNTDIRHKVDGLAMSPIFVNDAIIRLMKPQVDEELLVCYLNNFADFSKISEPSNWVAKYVYDETYGPLFQQITLNQSRSFILTALEIPQPPPERSALAEMDKILNIVEMRIAKAMSIGDDKMLQTWLKFKLTALEKQHAMHGGNADINTQSLLDALGETSSYRDPKIYAVEELNVVTGKVNE